MNSPMYNWLCELIFFDKEDIHKRGTICKNVHIGKDEFKRSSWNNDVSSEIQLYQFSLKQRSIFRTSLVAPLWSP